MVGRRSRKNVEVMKKTLLIGIAALLLATGAAHAEEYAEYIAFDAPAKNVWHFNDYKRCSARVEFKLPSNPNPGDWLLRMDGSFARDTAEVVFDRTNLAKLEAAVRFLKKCRACFWNKETQKMECLTLKQQKEVDNAN